MGAPCWSKEGLPVPYREWVALTGPQGGKGLGPGLLARCSLSLACGGETQRTHATQEYGAQLASESNLCLEDQRGEGHRLCLWPRPSSVIPSRATPLYPALPPCWQAHPSARKTLPDGVTVTGNPRDHRCRQTLVRWWQVTWDWTTYLGTCLNSVLDLPLPDDGVSTDGMWRRSDGTQ